MKRIPLCAPKYVMTDVALPHYSNEMHDIAYYGCEDLQGQAQG